MQKRAAKPFFKRKPKECKVAVLPDFFLDRLINLNWTPSEFSKLISDVAKRKGGSIDGVPQTDMRGGNAINVASALANLGATVTPIVCTSEYGLQQIKYYFKDAPVDLSHIKIRSKASITTALEFKNKEQKTNVMIRDLGSLADFGPEDLDENDYALIERCRLHLPFQLGWHIKIWHGAGSSSFRQSKKERQRQNLL